MEDMNVAQFKDGTMLAPDQLIAAMLAFSPELVIAVTARTAEDVHEWTLLGVTRYGLAIVAGATKRNPQDASFPMVTDLTATWTPISAVSAVQLVDVRASDGYYNRAHDVAIDATWVIELEGQTQLRLPEDPANREGAVLEFARMVLAKRQQQSASEAEQ